MIWYSHEDCPMEIWNRLTSMEYATTEGFMDDPGR